MSLTDIKNLLTSTYRRNYIHCIRYLINGNSFLKNFYFFKDKIFDLKIFLLNHINKKLIYIYFFSKIFWKVIYCIFINILFIFFSNEWLYIFINAFNII